MAAAAALRELCNVARSEPARRGQPDALPPTPKLPAANAAGFALVNGARLYYARFGLGDPVILLHGGMANSNYWGNQVSAIAAQHEVITIDFRGHGRSSLPPQPITYDLLASDVIALLDLLRLSKVAIVGWSDGGIVGLLTTINYPGRVTRLFAYGANFSRAGLIPHGATSGAFVAYTARTAVEYRQLSPQPTDYPVLLRQMRRMWSTQPQIPTARLATIQVPTTIADGDHDEIIRPQHTKELAMAIPSARLVIELGVSHFAMLQNPEQFTRDVLELLARH
jgi:pimeloyl-ACP methyl ester carboxylesterase